MSSSSSDKIKEYQTHLKRIQTVYELNSMIERGRREGILLISKSDMEHVERVQASSLNKNKVHLTFKNNIETSFLIKDISRHLKFVNLD